MQSTEMDTLEKLKLFREKAEELRQSRLLQKGISLKFRIIIDRTKGVLIETNKPDEEDVRSYLLTFRQFISEEEPIFIRHIYNLCNQIITDLELRERLAESRELWNEESRGWGIGFIIWDQEITPESATKLLINAHYFHNDPDKMALLKKLSSLDITKKVIGDQFRTYLVSTTNFILKLNMIIGITTEKDAMPYLVEIGGSGIPLTRPRPAGCLRLERAEQPGVWADDGIL